jgi:hypothetical protein
MGKLIRMIPLSETKYLFLLGVTHNDEVVYKTSDDINVELRDIATIEETKCTVGKYFFHITALSGLDVIN